MEAAIRFVKHRSSGIKEFEIIRQLSAECAIAIFRDYYNLQGLSPDDRREQKNLATDRRSTPTIRFPSLERARMLFDDKKKELIDKYVHTYIPDAKETHEIVEKVRQLIVSPISEEMVDADGSITIEIAVSD